MSPELLEIKDLRKRFGGIVAVDGVSFSVRSGEIVGMIGPNGSGKTTTINLITGLEEIDGGEIWFKGELINELSTFKIIRKGLARSFQLIRLFKKMTVLENMYVPLLQYREWRVVGGLVSDSERKRAEELLKLVGLYDLRNNYAENLSYGQQKLLDLASIMMMEPELIILDEPVAGVNPVMQEKIAEFLTTMNERGKTFLIIEHNMYFVAKLCNRVIVLDRGKVIAEGKPEAIQQDRRVLEAYLGE